MKNNFKAILFDVDGTLLDAKDFIKGAALYSLRENGLVNIKEESVEAAMEKGAALPAFYEVLAPSGNSEKLIAKHREFQLKNTHLVKPFPNAIETLRILKSKKIKLGAVTNRAKAVKDTLKVVGLLEFMDLVITAEDVINPKPHPEGIDKAVEILKIQKEELLFVGDSHADFDTAKNSKVSFAGVTYGALGEKIKNLNPNIVVSSFEELVKLT